MEDFTPEIFTIIEVLLNLPVPRYTLKEYNGDVVKGSFFEEELVRYDPPEFYEIDVIKTRGKGKRKEYLVHYRGWPSVYDEWKKQNEMKQIKKMYYNMFIFNNKNYNTKFTYISISEL